MADHKHGEMDIREQEQMFERFVRFSAWSCVLIIVALVLLAIINA